MTGTNGRPLRPTADQLLRRMLHAASHLESTALADAADLHGLDQQRDQAIRTAERHAREQADKHLERAQGLTEKRSLGRRLRDSLETECGATPQHADPGPTPRSYEQAVAEWVELSASVNRRVSQFRGALTDWNKRLFKRAATTPQVAPDLWRDLDRLDLLHQSVPSLRQAQVADAVREATAVADTARNTETARRAAEQRRLTAELAAAVADVQSVVGLAGTPWEDPRWTAPAPAEAVEQFVRLGELKLDASVPGDSLPGIPALTTFAFRQGIAIQSDMPSRDRAVSTMRALLLRLFAAIPPGKLQVRAVDPIALGQSVAEFRHLSEYDNRLVDEKTWTAERDIERLMDDVSDHLEVVISRYLRGQFDSIDDYNKHAGEVAQPYQMLMVFDFPSAFSDRSVRQLLSIIENGPRCGVFTVLHCDPSASSGDGHQEIPVERLLQSMQKVTCQHGMARLELPAPIGEIGLEFVPDPAAPVDFDVDGRPRTGFARLLLEVGAATKRAQERPPAVTLETLLPVLNRSRTSVLPDRAPGAPEISTDPHTWWRASTSASAVAPIGRSGAQNVTSMHFSSTEVAGGAIMIGLPRSGKTTSLHSMILTMCLLYPPEELELYLIDAKHGVEFKSYETLPHARMVSIHSEREFSLAVLKALEAEIRRRADLMKADGAGRANLTEYRRGTGATLSRIVLVMDEFHELFEEPDRIGAEAFAAFSNIVKMGSFSGVHVVVASQTLSNMPAMDRPTLLLLPQRVAFMCNEYDAEIVMGDANKAPRLLSKTGDGLFNPARGEESRNQPFQGLFVSTEQRADIVETLAHKATSSGRTRRPRVFDGDTMAVRPPSPPHSEGTKGRLTIPLGEPFTLASQESLVLRRTRGTNVLVLGGGDEDGAADSAALGVLHSCLWAGAAQDTEVTVVDFLGDDDVAGGLPVLDVAEGLGVHYVRSQGIGAALATVAATVEDRIKRGEYRGSSRLLVLVGLERALSLTPVDPYAYSESDTKTAAELLTAILQGGPEVGVHVVISADRARTVERRLGADLLGDLTLRVVSSGAEQRDLAAAAGDYGDIAALRPGQLLVGDLLKGTAKRIRGYAAFERLSASSHRDGA